MPEASYRCRFCNQDLSGYTQEDVNAHENIPFYKVNCEGLILKHGINGNFLTFGKANPFPVITSQMAGKDVHERLYPMLVSEGTDKMPIARGLMAPSIIDRCKANGEFRGISDEELENLTTKFNEIKDYVPELQGIGEFRTISD
jgi:hypothetical protein